MSFLQPLINDLREKRLWPVVVVLVGALVAVPVLLAKPAPKPQAAIALGAGATRHLSDLRYAGRRAQHHTSVLASAGPRTRPLHPADEHHEHDVDVVGEHFRLEQLRWYSPAPPVPMAPARVPGAMLVVVARPANTGSSTTTTQTTTTTTPVAPVKPEGLTPTESYGVTIAITKPSGGLDTIAPVERLTPLPSGQQPLLIELGVLKGGSEVLFVVRPGTVLSGPAKCLPGRIDCQIISLAPNQIESLSVKGATGPIHVSDFAVTGITTISHKSAAAAGRVRRQVSKTGQKLLRSLHYDALALFPYQPSVGAVVDQRNLTAGGS